jgi:CubicO group peptidase (beta-lactamase class C family)
MTRRRKPSRLERRRFLLAATAPVVASLSACGRNAGGLGTSYLGRYIFYNQPTNRDFERMPQRAQRRRVVRLLPRSPLGRFLAGGRVHYKRMWWGHRIDPKRYDYFAMGVLGEHVYVSPDTQTVIVRLSDRFPPGMWWAPVFRQLAEAVAAARKVTSGA